MSTATASKEHAVLDSVPKQLYIGGEWRDGTGGETLGVEDPATEERLALLATGTVGEGGWVELFEPIVVRAGEAFIAVPGPG